VAEPCNSCCSTVNNSPENHISTVQQCALNVCEQLSRDIVAQLIRPSLIVGLYSPQTALLRRDQCVNTESMRVPSKHGCLLLADAIQRLIS